MEDVRVRALDNVCEAIAETRGQINALQADERANEQRALSLMRQNSRTSYRHAGVELARVPGEEKLRVRTSKTNATAEVQEDDVVDDVVGAEFADERREALDEIDDEGTGD